MVGIDIVSIPRIEYLLSNKPNIIKNFFSKYEWEYAENKANISQTLTGIWCAKEAVVKSFATIEPIFITEIKLKHNSIGIPYILSIANKNLMNKYKINISISHSKEYATAIAMINTL